MRISKPHLSSDRSLQLDSVKLDSLVIAHQPWRGEYVPGPCTPPVKPWELGVLEVRDREERPRVNLMTGAKSCNKVAVPEGVAETISFGVLVCPMLEYCMRVLIEYKRSILRVNSTSCLCAL